MATKIHFSDRNVTILIKDVDVKTIVLKKMPIFYKLVGKHYRVTITFDNHPPLTFYTNNKDTIVKIMNNIYDI